MSSLLAWIVLIPLLSAFCIGLLYIYTLTCKPIRQLWFNLFALGAPLGSFILSLLCFMQILQQDVVLTYQAYTWLHIDNNLLKMGFLGDKLSVFMALLVTFVGWFIHVYAVAYMKSDSGYGKFFAYFNLFISAMLLLVLADSPLVMFIGWEGVGLCSYLLIGFYFQDPRNVEAGNKAFIVNRIGDMGFLVGLAILFLYCAPSGFDYGAIQERIGDIPQVWLHVIGITLFIGAMGKSAQIPLYVWLPDAMAGPTPVSALIHAATMVTAGVYMVTRFHFLYELIPSVGMFIAYIGALSAIFAALIATKQSDIKKILAYSTMSQLGYMFVSVGLGGYSVALFHVLTHAFFKAVLFMGAGAIIISLHHEQNIFKMGGLRKVMPITYLCMLGSSLAMSGIPPFSGFFSKDAILLVAFTSGEYLLWGMLLVSSALGAYYIFRLFFVVFEGENFLHVKEFTPLSGVMKLPIMVLTCGALVVGLLGLPPLFGGSDLLGHWLAKWGKEALHVSVQSEWILLGINVAVSLLGIVWAYKRFRFYDFTKSVEAKGWIYHKFYVDELYTKLFVEPLKRLSECFSVEIDIHIVDRCVMGFSKGFVKVGTWIGLMQNANVRLYASMMMLGVSGFCLYLIVVLG